MDAPLLALTRSRAPSAVESAIESNMRQLIQLRWLAVLGQFLTIVGVHLGLGVWLPLVPMLGVVALLAGANLAATALLPRHRVSNTEILFALLLDMAALTIQLYLSGGATNPFLSFYLLQVVLGAILLERWSAWVLVVVASLCFAGLSVHSVPLAYPAGLIPELADLHAIGTWIGFVLTGALLALFITRIIRNLDARDQYLADLRQHAAEEEGIVRMGLFASGAAHELGTPLASLSVILNDWQRMPRLARDPELAGEIDEMQAEVQRCKAIVTSILHSAGEPRGEAMERTLASSFFDSVASAWRPTHPHVPLDYRRDDLGAARLVGDPALRQAIGNLLDNAAEASPAGIAMEVRREADELVVAVTDRGPGFAPAQLPLTGKLYQSGKGAGHGVGLFLAANVARRLGGRLAAANRDEGGAEVTLVLPLATLKEDRDARH